MSCQPKVSVIVPVYNVEPYLRKCLDSLVNQTLKDIEVICINDRSPDNCLAILKEYAEKDSRVKIIDFEKNQGVSTARNTGIKAATGEYTGFCDPDDYLDLDFCDKLYCKAKETGADIAHSNVKEMLLGNKKEYIIYPYRKGYIDEYLMIFWQCIYRTDLLHRNKIEFPLNIISPGEDHCFLVKALIFANKKEYVHDTLYHYIVNSNSFVAKPLSIKSVDQLPQLCMIKLLNNSEIDKEFYLTLCRRFLCRFIELYHRFTEESKPLVISGFEKYCGLCKYPEDICVGIPISAIMEKCSFETMFFHLRNIFEKNAYPEIFIEPLTLKIRKIYVWGAGENGLDALRQCDNNGWEIEAFLDSSQQTKEFQGYKVLPPQHLLSSKDRDYFIIISSRAYAKEIARICEQAGLKEGEDFWRPRWSIR